MPGKTAEGRSNEPIVAMSAEERDQLLAESQDKPHEGRVYDYYLGGAANFEVDREFAKAQITAYPDLPWLARQNRKWVARVVRYLLAQGIRQFVDLGSGLPTEGNVHQAADLIAPGECRVVYVDHDPVAFAHASLVLELNGDADRHAPVCADVTDAERLWPAILSTGVIDPDQPIGVLLASVLHFVPSGMNPAAAVAYYRERVPSGSYLALSHGTYDGLSAEQQEQLRKVAEDYDRTTAGATLRSREQIRGFFGDWPLVEPGLVWTADWVPIGAAVDQIAGDLDPSRARLLAAVAVKP